MIESILKTIRVANGLEEEDNSFDEELLIHLNSAFFTLNQLGVGGEPPFVCTGVDQTWNDFSQEIEKLEMVKLYIHLKVRTLFDPPTSSYVLEAMNRQLEEMEWRLNAATDFEKGGMPLCT